MTIFFSPVFLFCTCTYKFIEQADAKYRHLQRNTKYKNEKSCHCIYFTWECFVSLVYRLSPFLVPVRVFSFF